MVYRNGSGSFSPMTKVGDTVRMSIFCDFEVPGASHPVAGDHGDCWFLLCTIRSGMMKAEPDGMMGSTQEWTLSLHRSSSRR